MLKEELLNLIRTYDESEILDFNENLNRSDVIGRYISVLGTKFDPYMIKTSGKKIPLIIYLEKFVYPRLEFFGDKFTIEEKCIQVLTIDIPHVNRTHKV